MKFKFLGLVWDLMPVVAFLWSCLLFLFVGLTFAAMFEGYVFGVLFWFFACMIWVYITSTVAANSGMNSNSKSDI